MYLTINPSKRKKLISLRKIIDDLLASSNDESAFQLLLEKLRQPDLSFQTYQLKKEIGPIVREANEGRGSRLEFELAASLVCDQAAKGGPIKGNGD